MFYTPFLYLYLFFSLFLYLFLFLLFCHPLCTINLCFYVLFIPLSLLLLMIVVDVFNFPLPSFLLYITYVCMDIREEAQALKM